MPIFLFDPDTDWIDSVVCLGRQLRPGDIVCVPAYIGQSTYTPPACYEIISIERAVDGYGAPYWKGMIRWDYGGLDDCIWSDGGATGLRYHVVGGDKIIRANTVSSSVVYLSGVGWDYREGRWK